MTSVPYHAQEKYAGYREEKGFSTKYSAISEEKNLPQHNQQLGLPLCLPGLTGDFAIKSDYCYQQEADLAVLFQGESSKLQISQNTGWVILAHVDGILWSLSLANGMGKILWPDKLFIQVTNTRFPEQRPAKLQKTRNKIQKGTSAWFWVLGSTPLKFLPGEKQFACYLLQ